MSTTPQQRDAIESRGNILVMAGAGTGKTRTLVERCLHILTHDEPRVHLDEMLIVTFTEAAAAEMRERIRKRLEREQTDHPEDPHWAEQLALFETAHIGTLHSYCFKLIRQHFYELGLDPQLAILTEHESAVLAGNVLEDLLGEYYEGEGDLAESVRRLVLDHGSAGSDSDLRVLIRRIHKYAQSLGDPESWFQEQLAHFQEAEPSVWLAQLVPGFHQWRQEWQPKLERLALGGANPVASHAAIALAKAAQATGPDEVCAAVRAVVEAQSHCVHGKTKYWVDPVKKVFPEAGFISALFDAEGKPNPLKQDWDWMRQPVLTLLEVTRQFGLRFLAEKRDLGVLDFGDLEQYALRLLWDFSSNRPRPLAQEIRRRLRFIFVDEYQDINVAQDRIIGALAREGTEANRFLVGDVKQSIYRFRLAAPRIFQKYAREWGAGPERVIPLSENFRSREGLLDFVNPLFAGLMRQDLGGVVYDRDATLGFGAPLDRAPLARKPGAAPRVELHLLVPDQEADEDDPLASLDAAAREARLVAAQLKQLIERRVEVWDEALEAMRPVQWRDVAILLRAPGKKAGAYATQFADLGVPLQVLRGGFFQSIEVSDLLSLLQILDNPLQDIPLLAVLHSPLVGLSPAELVRIRLAQPKGRFWVALTRFAQSSADGDEPELLPGRVRRFLDHFAHWRRLARQVSLSVCLETILTETAYADWLLTQPEGRQRCANLQRLLALAREFDRFQRQGLFRFVNFVQSQLDLESDLEVPRAAPADAVRLMSIHQSKGLEFPVVVLADIAKQFNLGDVNSALVFDEEYGVAGKVKPAGSGRRYPSLPLWLAKRRQTRELQGEELRLLYVAMTRARDLLILAGTLDQKKLDSQFGPAADEREALYGARSYSQWIGLSLGKRFPFSAADSGADELISWHLHRPASLPRESGEPADVAAAEPVPNAVFQQIANRLRWQYPFPGACVQPAKTSVSLLRRQANRDEEAVDAAPKAIPGGTARLRRNQARASEIGTWHHEFLQLMDVSSTASSAGLAVEARRLVDAGLLAREALESLDFEGLAAFWQTDLGQHIRSCPERIRREFPFTARFSPAELAKLTGQKDPLRGLEGEFVIVQGVADLVLVEPEGLTIVDFKTDHVTRATLPEKVRAYTPQLALYSRALERTLHQPVQRAGLFFIDARELVDVPV